MTIAARDAAMIRRSTDVIHHLATACLFSLKNLLLSFKMMRLVTLLLCLAVASQAFAPAVETTTTTRMKSKRMNQVASAANSALSMVPKYIGKKWVAQSDADKSEAGYDAIGTLLRHGPKPAFTRAFQNDDYEQAVLKFMAVEKCDRMTAQGNMDAYMRNPQDWAFSRMEDERRGVKRDYVTIQPKEVALVLVWSAFVSAVVGRAAYCIANGVDFYAFGPFTGSY